MKKIFALFILTIPAVSMALSLLGINALSKGNYGVITATQYYFSSNNGKDSNSGLSSSSPWQSMDKLRQLTKTLNPGDIVYFEKGSSWENAYFEVRNINATKNNPVLFTSYGSGSKPVFKGSKRIYSFEQRGNIWSTVDQDLPDYDENVRLRVIPFVYINGKKYDCSRHPNSGYLITKTTGVSNYLNDDTQSWMTNQWKNGLAVIRNLNWRWCSRRITSNTRTQLNFESMDREYEKANTQYLIRNHALACDENGEWAQQNDTLWIYSVSNLNAQLIEVPVIDTLIKVINCNHIEFNGIQLEKANVYGFYLNNSITKITNCNVSDVGGMLIFADNHCFTHTEFCSFTGGRRGGVYYDFSHGEVSHNTFTKMAFDGIDNTEHTYGPCISSWHSDGNFYSRYNRMDSINLGYNMHWSNDSVWIEYNFITNFGMTVADAAAIYFGSDFTGPNQGAYKYIRKNIMIKAHNRFVHGIYIDSGSNFFECDSNTIAHTNLAVFIHDSKFNIIKHTNIVDPAYGMNIYAWNQAIRLDEYGYQYGKDGSPVIYNVITDNNVVLGQTNDEQALVTLNVSELGTNTINNNKYFNPFSNKPRIFLISQDYTQYNFKDLNEWQSVTGKDINSSYNPINWTYSSVSGIQPDNFVLLLYNPTKKDSVFDLRNYGARYLDVDGNLVSDYVMIPSFYSKILFYKEKSDIANRQPTIANASFEYYTGESDNMNIGQITATDPDTYQQLTYSITTGNTNDLIGIDSETGLLFINDKTNLTNDHTLQLTVQVIDNGSPSRSNSAQADIKLIAFNNPPIINNHNYTIKDNSGFSGYIGKIVATDPDADQEQTFSIISGNADNLFSMDARTGDLTCSSDQVVFSSSPTYVLTVRVEDNGKIAKNSTAYVTVNFVSQVAIYYINPDNVNDPLEDGSIEHPFDSWNDAVWKEGYTYLQKKGTISYSDKIKLSADKITLGDYDVGEKPLIISNSQDFVIRGFERKNITVRNLSFLANEAISCIYFLGQTCENILIENCEFVGSENGVRIIDGKNVIIKYNVFQNKSDAIYTYAENTEVYYNIFQSNNTAVNVASYLSNAKIYNNVFYDNAQGIAATYADLVIYNNIFYLTRSGDMAINNKMDHMVSDHNIFYPEQQGFITMAGKAYGSLKEYQQTEGLDLNSFTQDPLFLDVYNRNFELLPESPAIDAGLNVGIGFDFLGLAVPHGGAPDIGSIEISNEKKVAATGIFNFSNEGLENELSVYPNPSDGRFNLYIGVSDIMNSTIMIQDMSGRMVYEKDHNSSESACVQMDISNQSKGVYIVVLQLRDKIYSKRVIIK
jgi:hypothetical protein